MINLWTAEEVEILRALAAAGMTSSEIRNHLPNKTRNAIVGKMSREKIENVSVFAIKAAKNKRGSKKKPPTKLLGRRSTKVAKIPAKIFEIINNPERIKVASEPKMKTMVDIGFGECRAIMSEINGMKTLFCSAPVQHASSYCELHHKKYYVKPERYRG